MGAFVNQPLTGFLLKSNKYVKGGNMPFYSQHMDSTVIIPNAGKYRLALWPPKDGKTSIFFKLEKIVTDVGENNMTNEEIATNRQESDLPF